MVNNIKYYFLLDTLNHQKGDTDFKFYNETKKFYIQYSTSFLVKNINLVI